jgi:hypothetical protein
MFERDSTPSLLVGKTLESIEVNGQPGDEMLFVCTDGEAFRAYHMQDCCESVSIHDIKGMLCDLIGSPIVEASEESESDEWPADVEKPKCTESFTWTTHRFKTQAGAEVVVRWLGESNGYYGEGVYFQRTHKPVDGFVA